MCIVYILLYILIIDRQYIDFIFDGSKNSTNGKKHGQSREAAERPFGRRKMGLDGDALVVPAASACPEESSAMMFSMQDMQEIWEQCLKIRLFKL